MENNDIYCISARVKNIIASQDIALSEVGKVLVNYYTLALKDLYDFSDTLAIDQKEKLTAILRKNENVPMKIIKVANPKPKDQFFEIRCWDTDKDEEFTQTVELNDIIETPYGMHIEDIGLVALNILRKQKGLSPLTKESFGKNMMELKDESL